MPAPPKLVVWPPVGVVAVSVRSDSVVIAADRRTVEYRSWDGRPPEPCPGVDTAKIVAAPGGCVLAFAGHAAVNVGDGVLDLRDVAVAAAAAADPATAARSIARALDGAAPEYRKHVGTRTGFPVPELGTVPIHFGVIVAACDAIGPGAVLAGLPVEGRAHFQDIVAFDGKVLAPESVSGSFTAPFEAACDAATPEDAAGVLVNAVGAAARREPALISFEQDTCILQPGRPPRFGQVTSEGGPHHAV